MHLRFTDIINYNSQKISFILSILIFIPTALYFIILCFKTYIHIIKIIIISAFPLVNIVYYFVWLFYENPYFNYFYLNENKNAVVVEKRKIEDSLMESTTGIKFLLSLPLIAGVCVSYFFLINYIQQYI